MPSLAASLLRRLLVITLMAGVVASAGMRGVAHEPVDVLQILADHKAEIAQHGHAHEDIHDLMHHHHAHDGHTHEFSEHDHNVLFMPPRMDATVAIDLYVDRSMANDAMVSRRSFNLDRPPRV
ncbi:MAG: hypothetical protein AB8B88_03460 [Devosiaceae bacterium]